MPFDSGSLNEIREFLPKARAAFEMHVESAALEVTAIARQISPVLGEVSIEELKATIVREFTQRLNETMVIDGPVAPWRPGPSPSQNESESGLSARPEEP